MRIQLVLSVFLLLISYCNLSAQTQEMLTNQHPDIDRVEALSRKGDRNSLIVLDSLKQARKNLSASEEVLLLLNRGRFYENALKFDSASIHFEQAITYQDKGLESLGFKSLGFCFNALGHCHWKMGNYDQSIGNYKKSIFYFEKISFDKGLSFSHQDLGLVYQEGKSDLVEAIKQFRKSMAYAESSGQKLGIPVNLHNIGLIKLELGLGREALETYVKATEFFESDSSLKKEKNYPYFLSKKAHVLITLGEYEQAVKLYDKILLIAKEWNDQRLTALTHRNLGGVYTKMNEFELAKKYLFTSKEKLERLEYKEPAVLLYQLLVDYYDRTGEVDSALYYIEKAIDLADTKGGEESQVKVRELKLKLLIDQQQWKESLELGGILLQKTQSRKQLKLVAQTQKLMAEAHRQLGNFQESVAYYQGHVLNRDSLDKLNEANDLIKAEIKTEFQTEKLKIEKENERKQLLLKQEIEQEKLLRTIAVMVLLLVVVGLAIVWRFYQQKKKASELIAAQKATLQAQHEQLEELLNFKENMTSMIVHDLKNPLSTVINLSSGGQVDSKRIQQEGKRMLNLVMNILEVGRYREASVSVKLEEVSLAELLEEAKAQVSTMQQDKSIVMQLPEVDITLKIDPYLVERVLVNLLTNAIKFSPLGGSIRITCQPVDEKWVQISMQDEGIGIPKEDQEIVFELYQQAGGEKIKSSTGLGLSYCKYTVEAHGGEIGIRSEEGKGTEVFFVLPLAEKQIENNSVVPVSALAKDEKEEGVLVPVKTELSQFSAYQYSEVVKVLDRLKKEELSGQMIDWMEAVEMASLTGNQAKYEQLTKTN
ncbi:tetratricopeptide repeat protein [Limibacter armeniacum]|uniref:ATP-binding protein n=1 Tax=Limibacter armeniacum TaxID=466084 RepID=UPI002FE534D4